MELVFTTFEPTNNMADLTNFWVVFGEASDSQYSGCYIWHCSQYPEVVTDIWKHVQYLLIPHSLKFTNFDDIPFRVNVTCAVMWQRSGTLLNSSDHTQMHASTQWDPTRYTMFVCFSNFSPEHGIWTATFVLRLLVMFDADRCDSLPVGTVETVIRQQCIPTEHDSQVIWRC